LALSALGLGASFLHLGHPERAWRAAAMWRTSWLSREVIALPAFMALVALYGLGHILNLRGTLVVGAAATVLCVALFVCTGMIYACIKFLQEWASVTRTISRRSSSPTGVRYGDCATGSPAAPRTPTIWYSKRFSAPSSGLRVSHLPTGSRGWCGSPCASASPMWA